MIYDGIINKPPIEEVLEHGVIYGLSGLLKSYKKRKKNTVKKDTGDTDLTDTERKAVNYTIGIGKGIKNAAEKSHKYLYKKMNKSGKVIYVYDTSGKAKLRRMTATK